MRRLPRNTFAFVLALSLFGCEPTGDSPDGECTPGTSGCPCADDAICAGGLRCDTGICREVDRVAIEVGDANARSCEVVVVEEGTEVLDVQFGEGVTGTSVHEAPRTAITFFRQSDTPFAADSVRVLRTAAAAPALRLRRARCFDREGHELPGDALRVGS